MMRPTPRHAACLLALALIAPPAFAQGPITRTIPPESAVDAIFKRYDSKDTPGCSVAVIDAGNVLLKKSYGMADPALGVPRTSTTSHWIPYSEARVFVALAVAMLARDGKLGLDDPIRMHVPEVPAYASSVTVRQLLHHTSGLADYGVLEPAAQTEDRVSEDELFRVLRKWNKLGFAPGTGSMYSNTDYALLKMLVERRSGGSLHDYLHAKLLKPLGMTSTRIGADQGRVFPGHALFHLVDGDGVSRELRYRTNPVGQISVTTNLEDLIRWEAALRDPASGLALLLKQLERGAPPAHPGFDAEGSPSDAEGYSFGVFRRNYRGLPLVEYRGISGYHYLVQVPGTGLSVATLCNVYPGMDGFGAEVARLYAAPSDGEPTARALALGQPRVLPASELQRYVGEYRNPNARRFVDVTLADGALAIVPRGGTPLQGVVARGGGQFTGVINDDWTLLLTFKEGENGGMTMSQWDASNNESTGPDFQRWTAWKPDTAALQAYEGLYVGDDVEAILHVRSEDGRVLVASHTAAETALNPWDKPDHFAGPDIYTSRFERDASGRVVALVLDATRVKGMRYTKQ